jgi:hypothetical protein
MFKIFICYRTADTAYASGHIYSELSKEFGKENIFEYNHSMPAGVNFRNHVRAMLQRVQVFIPVIGAKWLNCSDENGNQRIFQSEDPVRIEVETAINLDHLIIIPVFVDGINCPAESQLPEEIRQLIQYSAVNINPKPGSFSDGIERLIDGIKMGGVDSRTDKAEGIRILNLSIKQLEIRLLNKRKEYNTKSMRFIDARNALLVCILVFLDFFNEGSSEFFRTIFYINNVVMIVAIIWMAINRTKLVKQDIAKMQREMAGLRTKLTALSLIND